MSTEAQFLLRYGLQNFVRFSESGTGCHFAIDGTESRKMINHAACLITEMYGADSSIRIV